MTLTLYKLCQGCWENKPHSHYVLTKDRTRTNQCTDCIMAKQKELYEDFKILGVLE